MIKKLPAIAGDIKTWVRSLGQEDLLEEGMAIHSGILAWKILQGCKELDMTEAT